MITRTKDTYQWRALYQDGSELDEQDATRGFASVDQSQVQSILLLQGETPMHQVDTPPDAQAVFFRRRSAEIDLADGSTIDRGTVHCIGWKRNDEAVYLFIGEDGKTLLSSDLQAV